MPYNNWGNSVSNETREKMFEYFEETFRPAVYGLRKELIREGIYHPGQDGRINQLMENTTRLDSRLHPLKIKERIERIKRARWPDFPGKDRLIKELDRLYEFINSTMDSS